MDNQTSVHQQMVNHYRSAIRRWGDAGLLLPLVKDAIDPPKCCILNDSWLINIKEREGKMEHVDLTEEMKELIKEYHEKIDDLDKTFDFHLDYMMLGIREFVKIYDKRHEYKIKLESLMRKLNIKCIEEKQ